MLQRRELSVDAFLGYTMEIQHTLPRSSGLSMTSNVKRIEHTVIQARLLYLAASRELCKTK